MIQPFTNKRAASLALALCGSLLALSAQASDNVRHHLYSDSDYPVAQAVEVSRHAQTIYLSGNVPEVADKDADEDSVKAYGNTREQTQNVLEQIKSQLKDMGYDMGDVVKMNVYIAPDPDHDDTPDFDGFMKAYKKFFGTDKQSKLPARTAIAVPKMVNPGMLIEIDVTAAK